jgi:hypothetical protein
MLDNSHTTPHSPETDSPRPDGGDSRLATLQEQERLWFSWLTVLHERLNKLKPGDAASEGLKVLEIARRRWAEARTALREYEAGD